MDLDTIFKILFYLITLKILKTSRIFAETLESDFKILTNTTSLQH